MTSIIIIDKNSSLSEKKVKTIDKLYSSCNYRTNKDFELLHTWNNAYELYGKKSGKTNSENKYKFPLIDETYYGNLCIIKKGHSLTLEEWNKFYNSAGYENEKNDNDTENDNDQIDPKTETENDNDEIDPKTETENKFINKSVNTLTEICSGSVDDELSYDEYEEETSK